MSLNTVKVPEPFRELFESANSYVKDYFESMTMDPSKGTITIGGERYILVRAASMSVHFVEFIRNMYPALDSEESFQATAQVLFDMAHVIGKSDAKNFHAKEDVTDPIAKLSTGPIHFAFSGWAFVEIDERSNPSPDEDYCLFYSHPYSFECDSWKKLHGQTEHPVCHMNAGYSSGWCAESFGMNLVAREVKCQSRGDDTCSFVMAQPHRIDEFCKKYE